MKIKGKIMISCHEATFLISKKQEEKLSLTEQMKLSLHLMYCKYCNRFAKQTKEITKAIKEMNRRMQKNSVKITLTEEQKKRIKKAINNPAQ